jgi:DNA-binding NarL/FixJ family response regulator
MRDPTNDQLCGLTGGRNSRDVTREPPSDRVRVLIVDDDDDFASAMRATLSADGRIDVAGIAHDGLEALELTKSLRPDLVLLDLEMPRMDGYETLRRLNRRARKPPVIVLTGVTDLEDLARAARLHPDALLQKTVDAEAIVPGVVMTLALSKRAA